MADHILSTRVLLRYGTYGQWMNSDVVLMLGEVAIAAFPNDRSILTSNITPDHTPPAIGMKVGDGEHYFRELPWVQSVAADVYSWAKSAVKPTYRANEIQGLAAYIEEHSSGGGSGAAVARQYQLIQGTDDDINKYFLRYRDSGTDEWSLDTTHYVDLSEYARVKQWIGNYDLTNYTSLAYRTEGHIQLRIGELNKTDTAVEHQFVTSVSEAAGKITVARSTISFSDIDETLGVSQGGTGVSTLPVGEVLLGNGTGAIRSIAIDREVDETTNLVTNYAVKAYVDAKTAGLTGAMHYIGAATVDPEIDGDPQIQDYDVSHAQRGDVIIWRQKEYVWANGWHLLGDEGSYAVKGSIVDADIDREANISQSKINGLITDLDSKVDKVLGKQLSTNDYTDADLNKLAGIESGAQRNTINGIKIDGTLIQPQDTIVNLNISDIFSSQLDKLADIEAGANVNTIEIISLNGTPQPIVDKEVNLVIREFSQAQQEHLESIARGAEVNVITGIKLNNNLLVPQERIVNIDIASEYSNELEKLNTIARGAQVNIIEHITIDGTEIRPNENKTIAITTDPHTEHINKIEHILVNGVETAINTNDKSVNLVLTENTLPLFLLKGATITNNLNEVENVTIDENNKLAFQFHKIAKTGDVKELGQTSGTFILIDCGTSDSDAHPVPQS